MAITYPEVVSLWDLRWKANRKETEQWDCLAENPRRHLKSGASVNHLKGIKMGFKTPRGRQIAFSTTEGFGVMGSIEKGLINMTKTIVLYRPSPIGKWRQSIMATLAFTLDRIAGKNERGTSCQDSLLKQF